MHTHFFINQIFTNANFLDLKKTAEYPTYDDYGDRLSSEILENVPSPSNLGPFGNILVTGALVFALR